jgi:large subunit ribosomal protein L23
MNPIQEESLLKILLSPHVSEKATVIADKNRQFVFQVAKDATKITVKSAVEKLLNVEVAEVRILNVKGKTRRFRGIKGKLSSWKKAYVKLMPGHDIDFTSINTEGGK